MVQNVEGVELEFEFQLLSQGGDLESTEVKGDVTWSAEGVAAGVSKNLGIGGNAKSIDVEPLPNRARSIQTSLFLNSLGPIPFVRFRTADSMSAQSVAFRSMTLLPFAP
jgi:hypothetical protein